MRRFAISEMDDRALELARKWKLGVETIDFCIPENLENEALMRAKRDLWADIAPLSLHAPYYELFPCAIDPMIRAVAMHRMRQSLAACQKMGVKRMVAHSAYAPQMYYPEWFVPKSIAFWREFAQELPEDFELVLENVLDVGPDCIAQVCDGVDDPRVGLCLDVGHANAYSDLPLEAWIARLGGRIKHVHLHNNNGDRDAHAALDCGGLDMRRILELLDQHAPQAEICIESMDAPACIAYLLKEGYLDDTTL